MKKFLLTTTSALLVFSLVGCSSEPKKKAGTLVEKEKETEVTEESIETEETNETEITEPVETEPTETDIITTIPSTDFTLISGEYEYIDFDIYTEFEKETFNDNNFYVGAYYDYLGCPNNLDDDLYFRMWEINDATIERLVSFEVDQEEFSNYLDKSEYNYSFFEADLSMSRNDTQVISGNYYYSSYSSFSEDNQTEAICFNIDPSTSNDIKLSSLIINEPEFKDYVINSLYFEDDYNSDMENYIMSLNLDDFKYVITPLGIKLIFNPGEVCDVKSDFITVNIQYLFYPSIFSCDIWTNYPTNKVIPLYYSSEADYLYLDEDKYVSVEYGFDEYNDINKLTIITNENEESFDLWGFDHDAYYVSYEGREYVIVSTTQENDYKVNDVFDITEEITEVGSTTGSIVSLINPQYIFIEQRLHQLSTINTIGRFSFTKNGNIEFVGVYYDVSSANWMTTIIDLTAKDGTVVPAGTELKQFITDRETYTIMVDEDYNEYEFSVSGYGEINGMSVYDVFEEEDILFAG